MPTYSTSAAGTVGAGTDKIFEFETVTIASGEQFKRCKIEIQGSYNSYARLRGNAQSVLGQSGWNTWTTDRTAISWPNNGKKPKVTVHNNDTSTGHSWRVIVTIESEPKPEHTITCSSGTGGTLTASKSKAIKNETITLTPTPAAGYQLSSITTNVSGVTVSNNKFTMPDQNITVTATWTKISYTITKAVSPSGAGTVSGSSSAQMGTSVTLTQSPNSGYYFDHWSISTGTISGGTFTMPAANVTVTAHYLKRSTATINKTTLKGGETAVLTISPASSSFSHKYKLSFGTGMETSLTTVAAGTTGVTLNIPTSWADQIPNAVTKTGGTLKVETYSGSTKIGEYTISGLTYQVPDDAKPSIGTITTSIARTIGGTTYANIGSYYVQSKCGVRIQATGTGAYSATIASMKVSVSGYTATGTASSASIDYTTGLLTIAGNTTITITATDSRGRISTKTKTITVMSYTAPAGTLSVERANANGDPDDVGQYGIYELTKQYTQIGSNTLTATLTSQSVTVTVTNNSGNLLPGTGNRQTFQMQNEYTITLRLTDAFGTTTITEKLRSAKFVMYVDSGGDRLGFFKSANKTIPSGKTSTLEIGAGTQVYIGDDKLENLFDNFVYSGTLPNNSNLNTVDTPGNYLLSSNYTYTNTPNTVNFLIVKRPTSTSSTVLQIAIGVNYLYYRFRTSATSWSNWKPAHESGEGWAETGTNIDNILAPGRYGLDGGRTYGGTFPTGVSSGLLEVLYPETSTSYIWQRLTTGTNIYIRYRNQSSGTAWGSWYKFTGTLAQ